MTEHQPKGEQSLGAGSEDYKKLAQETEHIYFEHKKRAIDQYDAETSLHSAREAEANSKAYLLKADVDGFKESDNFQTRQNLRRADKIVSDGTEHRQKEAELNIEHAKQHIDLQLEKGAKFADQNLDQLTQLAKQEAEAAGHEVNLDEELATESEK